MTSYGFRTLAFLAVSCWLSNNAPAQTESAVGKDDFLTRYRDAIPKLERTLFRNKTIEAELITYNRQPGQSETPEANIWRRATSYKSNDDRLRLVVSVPGARVMRAYVLRPGQYYGLSKSDGKPYVVETNKHFLDSTTEILMTEPWWANPHVRRNNGIGYGVMLQGTDWYYALSKDILPIQKVVDTSYEGRPCYQVWCGMLSEAKRPRSEVFFDKSNFMVFRCIYTYQADSSTLSTIEELVDYDCKPGDYDSIVLKKFQLFAENKGLSIPRHLSEETRFTVYENATHPPETFRLEQFGLPDVPERLNATSRRSLAFVAAGVLIGGLVLVGWLIGRRRVKNA